MNKPLLTLALLALTLIGGRAHALQITEIMYDVPGADSGREWIEVTNTESGSKDITGYKFFQGNSNHGLTVLSGSLNLPAGGSAVIVGDQSKFMADWPSFSGTLIKASFSLNNTGETISMKDPSGAVVDTVTYSATTGAAGDGNSLQRSGSNFAASAPTPGSYSSNGASSSSSSATADSDASEEETSTQSSQTQTAFIVAPDPLTARITAASSVTVGAGSFFSGQSFDAGGVALRDARYIWNFGDGSTGEGQNVFHVYSYPGKYLVMLTVSAHDTTGMARATVSAAPAQIGILAEPDGSVVLVNHSKLDLNVGLWSVVSGTSTFVIPQHTTVLGGQSIHLSAGVLRMHAAFDAALYYPNGTLATKAQGSSTPALSLATLATQTVAVPVVAASPKIAKTVQKKEVSPAPVATSTQVAAAAQASGFPPLLTSLVGLFGVIVLGVAALWYARLWQPGVPAVTKSEADEFEILHT